jgi:hypothetical protein
MSLAPVKSNAGAILAVWAPIILVRTLLLQYFGFNCAYASVNVIVCFYFFQ